MLKSIHQALTGRRSAFKRTPKVSGSTAAPPAYVVLPYAALAYLPLAVVWDSLSGNLLHAALSVCNVILLAYAVRTFIGWRAIRGDASSLLAPLAAATRAPERPIATRQTPTHAPPDPSSREGATPRLMQPLRIRARQGCFAGSTNWLRRFRKQHVDAQR